MAGRAPDDEALAFFSQPVIKIVLRRKMLRKTNEIAAEKEVSPALRRGHTVIPTPFTFEMSLAGSFTSHEYVCVFNLDEDRTTADSESRTACRLDRNSIVSALIILFLRNCFAARGARIASRPF